MDDYWTLWVLGADGLWMRVESHSRRADAERAALAYGDRPVQLRDPLGRMRWETADVTRRG